MKFLKRTLPEIIIRKLGRHPVAVLSTATLGFRLSKDGWRLKKGEIDVPEFRRRVGGHFGTVGGGIAGAAAGAAAGSAVIPGLGTILGAFAGGMVGETLGGKLGRGAIEGAETLLTPKPTEPAPDPGHPKRSL
ncbi:MAG: hypothetical protein IPG45_38275 [Deltaproteobacteria bacterium]|jgi:hypothetical protein|nr:hypothetical protein [Deltaproteobacteria bacterium]